MADLLHWFFSKTADKHRTEELKILESEIGDTHRLLDRIGSAIKKKEKLNHREKKNKDRITKINFDLIADLKALGKIENLEEILVKKIILESSERLHEVSHDVWQVGRNARPTKETYREERKISKNLEERLHSRNPYKVEWAKRALSSILYEEEQLRDFIQKVPGQLRPEMNEFKRSIQTMIQVLTVQNRDIRRGNFERISDDSNQWNTLKIVVEKIMNLLFRLAKEMSSVEMDEEKILKADKSDIPKQYVGVMLVHAITNYPSDFNETEQILRKQGYIVYNVRLPGHRQSLNDFFNTPIGEISNFLMSAYKYFYKYMASLNKRVRQGVWYNPQTKRYEKSKENTIGDGRFYVMGISIGAMLSIQILAKHRLRNFAKQLPGRSEQKGYVYPYQGMVKGFVCMSACIFSGDKRMVGIRKLSEELPGDLNNWFIRKIAPKVLDGPAFKSYNPDMDAKLRDKFEGEILANIPHAELIHEITPLVDQLMLKYYRKKYFQDIYKTDEERNEFREKIIRGIVDNLKKGKHGLNNAVIMDESVLLTRESIGGHAGRSIAQMSGVIAQLRDDVKHLKLPLLIFQGMQDTVSDPASGEYLLHKSQTPNSLKKRFKLHRSGHIVILDYDKEKIFRESLSFFKRCEKYYSK